LYYLSFLRDYDPLSYNRSFPTRRSSDLGGWGAFDADNTHYYLNHIPFADHGALLDPPTEDVSARCVSMLAQLGDLPKNDPRVARSEEHTSELQSQSNIVCRLLLEKTKTQ